MAPQQWGVIWATDPISPPSTGFPTPGRGQAEGGVSSLHFPLPFCLNFHLFFNF